jgi:hypothetical protein
MSMFSKSQLSKDRENRWQQLFAFLLAGAFGIFALASELTSTDEQEPNAGTQIQNGFKEREPINWQKYVLYL